MQEPSIDFDWEAIDPTGSHVAEDQIAMAATALRAVFSWVWQRGPRNPNGFRIRTMLICWLFLPELRKLSMSEFAARFGLKKQSLGRWAVRLKRDYPFTKFLLHDDEPTQTRKIRLGPSHKQSAQVTQLALKV